ncbi:contractile injection system tape measure protein [Chitinophaga vietnamensis]|uniref:contractile injection system tape measure protein n=1 Tax=Chitinophaga vietnamensis TaxID=2593957 RepID=UPI00117842BF|nr:contractile injection system tape measure protein [Chitinophaga vietnamensis]
MSLHVVNRLQFMTNCYDEEQALNLRHNFALTLQDQVMAALDKVCSRYVGDDEFIRIDKLEIDLGHLSAHAFSRDFEQLFTARLEAAISKELAAMPAGERSAAAQLSRIEILQFFLSQGVLPWWAEQPDFRLPDVAATVLLQQPAAMKQWLGARRSEQNIWTRITWQLPQEVKSLIIFQMEELIAAQEQLVATLVQMLIQAAASGKISINGTPALLQQQIIAAAGPLLDDIILANAVYIFQTSSIDLIQQKIFSTYAQPLFAALPFTIPDALIAELLQALPVPAAGDVSPEMPAAPLPATTGADDLLNNLFRQDEEVIEKIAVRHAGVVLLTPFLKQLFSTLSLLEGKDWKDKESQYKAIHLLRFLATGETMAPEYNLALEKICCGLSLDEPIPLETALDDNMKAEGEALLSSVIEHWQLLKNTSVNGLRTSFLCRDGLLSRKDGGWLLQVEQKTLDVLLSGIPWGYSTITLSWNPYLIYVEW